MHVYLVAGGQLLGLSIPYSPCIASALVRSVTPLFHYRALRALWVVDREQHRGRWLAVVAPTGLARERFTVSDADRPIQDSRVALDVIAIEP
ncbi:MAG: hypothetical protein GX620_13155 [Chloroflexi bacterium]|nr:hypothetical protein [Chloroflexota bacterium]